MARKDVERIRELDAQPLHKLLLYALESRSNRAGLCWPSVRRLSQDTGLSRRAVQINMGLLIDRGALAREGRHGRSNVYCLTLDNVVPIANSYADEENAATGGQPHFEVRMSCAPPAHVVRPPAHDVRTPCAPRAPEVKREVVMKCPEKPGPQPRLWITVRPKARLPGGDRKTP